MSRDVLLRRQASAIQNKIFKIYKQAPKRSRDNMSVQRRTRTLEKMMRAVVLESSSSHPTSRRKSFPHDYRF